MITEFKIFENGSFEIHKLKEFFDPHRFDNEYMTPEKYVYYRNFVLDNLNKVFLNKYVKFKYSYDDSIARGYVSEITMGENLGVLFINFRINGSWHYIESFKDIRISDGPVIIKSVNDPYGEEDWED